jgi:hypothetical protein
MRRTSVVLLCLPAVALAGCGTSADRAQSRAAVQALYAAVQRHDGAAACAQMSPSLRQQIVHDSGSSCAKAVLDFDLRPGRPTTVHVYADAAQVRLTGGDTAFLDDTRQGWRVEAVGCRPQGKGPYECEAAA